MPALLDIALAILVLSGAYLLFGAAAALLKEIRKDDSNDKTNPPGA